MVKHLFKTFALSLFFILFSKGLVAQERAENLELSFQQRLSQYFNLHREQVYLHLNKSIFVEGETLWFKGYVYDFSQKKPSVATKNIEVGLYDKEGDLVTKALFYGEKGYTRGQFLLDSVFSPGEYYIRATTNWLRNFKEDHDYLQRIKILGKENREIINDNQEISYDLQFMPEGGYLISDLENSVGVLLKDDKGKGVSFKKGVIFDENGNKVTTFKSNLFGIGNFLLNTQIGANYTAKVFMENGTIVESDLPSVENQGLALRVVNTPSKGRFLEIRTNLKTYKKIEGFPYYIMYHQDGKSSFGEVSFNNGELMLRVQIKDENLYDGVNTVTLFDLHGKPLLERLIFKDTKFLENNVALEAVKNSRSGDSISFYFSSNKKSLSGENKLNISISVLPENTVSYNHQDNIIYSFLLKPYVKGYVENPDYYFKYPSKKKFFELDLLLLTQGWSRYDWNNIFTSPPNAQYKFEQGISISTSVQKNAFLKAAKKLSTKEEEIKNVLFYLYPTKRQKPIVAQVKDDNRVFLNNLYYAEGDTLKYSIVNPEGNFFKSMANIEIKPVNRKDKLDVPEYLNLIISRELNDYALSESELLEFYKNIISLDEVVVSEEAAPKKNSKYNSTLYSRESETQIDAKAIITFPLLIDVIRFKGFRVSYNPRTFQLDITQNFPTFSPGGATYLRPIIFLDGTRLIDFDILVNMRTDEVEKLYANPRDISYGMRSAGGAIRITSRRTAIDYGSLSFSDEVDNYRAVPIDFPFKIAKEYYRPIYNNYDSAFFDLYGAIHWEPEIDFNERGDFVVSTIFIPNKKYNFYFEGMGEGGKLLSAKITIDPNQNK
ncbi:hypothetical protein [uncultured Croceitalea sp.]|uniref:hypothetical protein n=1 Tax=uncultured Croceitalea sp. TaxID=1798908 RepID=UPI00374EFC10